MNDRKWFLVKVTRVNGVSHRTKMHSKQYETLKEAQKEQLRMNSDPAKSLKVRYEIAK